MWNNGRKRERREREEREEREAATTTIWRPEGKERCNKVKLSALYLSFAPSPYSLPNNSSCAVNVVPEKSSRLFTTLHTHFSHCGLEARGWMDGCSHDVLLFLLSVSFCGSLYSPSFNVCSPFLGLVKTQTKGLYVVALPGKTSSSSGREKRERGDGACVCLVLRVDCRSGVRRKDV